MTDTQVALITGGAQRIGAALSRAFHQAGYNVVIHYGRSHTEAQALCDELNSHRPDSVVIAQAELSAPEQFRALAQQALAAWGHVDVLLNNASRFYPTPLAEVDETAWQDLIGSNLQAPLFLAQALTDSLKARTGCIINMVDIYAERPLTHHPLYSISKAGIAMLTKTLALELGPEVRVNGISPGAILWPTDETSSASQQAILDKTALKRIGSPEDICQAALYLTTAGYVTGQIIAVDGGRSLNL